MHTPPVATCNHRSWHWTLRMHLKRINFPLQLKCVSCLFLLSFLPLFPFFSLFFPFFFPFFSPCLFYHWVYRFYTVSHVSPSHCLSAVSDIASVLARHEEDFFFLWRASTQTLKGVSSVWWVPPKESEFFFYYFIPAFLNVLPTVTFSPVFSLFFFCLFFCLFFCFFPSQVF